MVPSQKKAYELHELLYYDIATMRNGDLRKGLTEYKSLLAALHSAMCAFEDKDLEKFDALVGENACQIRAIKIAIISSQNKIDCKNIKKQTNEAKNKISELLSNKIINSLMHSGVTLGEILEKDHLNISLSSDEMFVLQSFLLSLMKESQTELQPPFCMRDKAAPKKFKSLDPAVSSQFAKNIASKTRRLLAEASVRFTREMAWKLEDTNLVKMVSSEFTRQCNSWPCTPMFWTYKTLLKAAQKANIPLVILAKFIEKKEEEYVIKDQEVLFFRPTSEKNAHSYVQDEPNRNDLENSSLVIQGFVYRDQEDCYKMKWKEEIANNSIIDVILAGAADHRQYPDQIHQVPTSDLEFDKYRTIAQRNGFSIDNPSTFFINHIYPLQVAKLFTAQAEHCSISATS